MIEYRKYYRNIIKEKEATDRVFKLKRLLRKYLSRVLFVNNNRTARSLEYIGCTLGELQKYIESKFYTNPETGEQMTWDNHGIFGWHIDHIVPLASANTEEDLYKLCHYTNLQPLWAKDNLSKGTKA